MSFSSDLETFAQKTSLKHETVLRAVTLSMFNSAVLISPVKTGNFRRNWTMTMTADRGLIQNDTVYGPKLNAGSSQQAPAGIIPVLVVQFETFVTDALNQVGNI